MINYRHIQEYNAYLYQSQRDLQCSNRDNDQSPSMMKHASLKLCSKHQMTPTVMPVKLHPTSRNSMREQIIESIDSDKKSRNDFFRVSATQ